MFSDFYYSGFYIDHFSFLMVGLSFFLSVLVSILVSNSNSKLFMNILMCSIAIFFFTVDGLLWFFVLFEFSLVPLLFMVVSWGRQTERLVAARFLFMYTIISSSPLLGWLLFNMTDSPNFSIQILMNEEWELFVIAMTAFFVKIPLFMFHSWLPKAHVEATLEGSTVLAGIMLKVGVYGLYRILSCSSFDLWVKESLFSLSLIGSFFSTVAAMSSDDMKMSVAFSSISHMNFAVSFFLVESSSSLKGLILISFTHGLSSPLLFYIVTKVYMSTHSRSFLLGKGLLAYYPMVSVSSFFLWSMNLSTPPFFSFIGETIGIVSLTSFFLYSLIFIVLYIVSMSFFSMFNYGVLSHSSFNSFVKNSLVVDYQFMIVFFTYTGIMIILFFSNL